MGHPNYYASHVIQVLTFNFLYKKIDGAGMPHFDSQIYLYF